MKKAICLLFISLMLFACKKDDPVVEEEPELENTGEFTDTRDNYTYKWVRIGDQIWLAENLAYDIGDFCWAYDNDENNIAKYGRLYHGQYAKSACPDGWHLPTSEEWEQLAQYISTQKELAGKTDKIWPEVGKYLKATSGWNENSSGTDDFNFLAAPGGGCYGINYYSGAGKYGIWWTASRNSSTNYYVFWSLSFEDMALKYNEGTNAFGFSIRCVKDSD